MAGGERVICAFGAKRLLPRIKAFSKETDGVRKGSDPEHVHWMRVASRRIRSALPLFSRCFPERKYRRWIKEVKAITGALGDARDTDVQIAFLAAYARDYPAVIEGSSGIEHLADILHNRRIRQQDDVVLALDRLERSRTLQEMADVLRKMRRIDGRVRQKQLPRDVYREAAARIHPLLDNLLSHDRIVHNPDDAYGHHAMRIAAKKVRYTLEIYRPLYSGRLKKPLVHLKKLQEILGELHDCDVWAGIIAGVIAQDAGVLRNHREKPGSGPPAIPDFVRVLLDRKKRRDILHRELVVAWEECSSGAVWEHVRMTTGTYLKAGSANGTGLTEKHKLYKELPHDP